MAIETNVEEEKKDTVIPEESTEAMEDGLLSLENASRMLRWHGEAIGRCIDLSAASEV